MTIKEISKLKENGKYSCNVCEKEYTKGGISTHYWLNHGDGGEHLNKIRDQVHKLHESKRGKPAWNSGLTAETDERVLKMKESLIKLVKADGYKNSRKGVHLSDSEKEKLSEARSRFLNENGNGGFKHVGWYKSVDSFGNECSLRGTWECKVAEWLTLQGIMWTRKHYIKYFDGSINRTYSPDFFIPADNTVIEVKGYYSDNDKQKMKFVKEQHSELIVKMIMQKEIDQLSTLTYNNLQ